MSSFRLAWRVNRTLKQVPGISIMRAYMAVFVGLTVITALQVVKHLELDWVARTGWQTLVLHPVKCSWGTTDLRYSKAPLLTLITSFKNSFSFVLGYPTSCCLP